MRTPGIVIFGLVLAPCGWILDLTSTVAPSWRTLNSLAGESSDTVLGQGIWDICKSFTTSSTVTCNLRGNDQLYFSNRIVTVAQGMMVASLIVTLIGLAIVTPGARCWTDRRPRWILVGLGGILIFISGALAIIPVAWYTYSLTSINTTTVFTTPANPDIRVGYCLVLGYIGGIMEVLAGFVLFIGICSCCGGKNRGDMKVTSQTKVETRPTRATRPTPYPRMNVPRTASSNSSSVATYSRDTLDDDLDFPRAKSAGKGSVNPSFSAQPYDADL